MVIDIDGGSQNSNARLLQFPQKKNNSFEQFNQRFRLHPIVDRTSQQSTIDIPTEFFRWTKTDVILTNKKTGENMYNVFLLVFCTKSVRLWFVF